MRNNSLGGVRTDRRKFLLLAGGGLVGAAKMEFAAAPSARAATAAPDAPALEIAQRIVTGKMDGKPGWPKFVPANLFLPAHSLIEVTVRCYDDGSASIPAGLNAVSGTINDEMRLIKGQPDFIAADMGKLVKEVPVDVVAHTLTVNDTRFPLNVPIPLLSTVVYRFKSPAPGTYDWQCMAACGTGKKGWDGAMKTGGWMRGKITVV